MIIINYIRYFIYFFVLLYSPSICNDVSGKHFVNHLVEKEGFFFLPYENKKVYGELFKYFIVKNQVRKNEYVGMMTKNGKVGIWTRRWGNGFKKSSGEYINFKKEGLWKDWNKKGKQIYQTFYENGKVIYLLNCLTEKCL